MQTQTFLVDLEYAQFFSSRNMESGNRSLAAGIGRQAFTLCADGETPLRVAVWAGRKCSCATTTGGSRRFDCLRHMW